MKVFLENIRKLQKEILRLENLKTRTSNSSNRQAIDDKITLYRKFISLYKEITDPFVNGQRKDVRNIIISYYYGVNSWNRAVAEYGNKSVEGYRSELKRLCEAWRN